MKNKENIAKLKAAKAMYKEYSRRPRYYRNAFKTVIASMVLAGCLTIAGAAISLTVPKEMDQAIENYKNSEAYAQIIETGLNEAYEEFQITNDLDLYQKKIEELNRYSTSKEAILQQGGENAALYLEGAKKTWGGFGASVGAGLALLLGLCPVGAAYEEKEEQTKQEEKELIYKRREPVDFCR